MTKVTIIGKATPIQKKKPIEFVKLFGTMNITNAKLGVTHIVIHSGTTFSLDPSNSTLVKLTGSGNFKAGVTNYIYFTFVGGSTVIYSINQAA